MPEILIPRDDSHCAESLIGGREGASSEENAKKNQVTSDTLRRAPYIIILALLYAIIALFSWATFCTLSRRPIWGKSYNIDFHSIDGLNAYFKSDKKNFDEDERIFRAARFCQSLASVLTIPLTSMVCSCAMVGFLQKRTKQGWRSLTLRQSMTLADKGWTDPVTITKLVSGGWKRYGSIFLIFALILNLIGQ